MNFVIRSIGYEDLDNVVDIARQFSLLNLPPDKKIIEKKIDLSIASFAGEVSKDEAQYIFVTEDIEGKWIAGSSQLIAKHGTENEPTYSFEVLKKERFSRDLGVGFIHQILRLKINTNGPTEVGGLVVDKSYRNRPEKVGKGLSLARFVYLGMNKDKFQPRVYAQMAPPLTEEGRSEFWEALGRRFTGMPYQEADLLSQQNQEFIRSLFPEEDIYLALLEAKARLVMGRVGPETQPALHLLESMGFKYMSEVDPFDGGPHYHCKVSDIEILKKAQTLKFIVKKDSGNFDKEGLIGIERDGQFFSGWSLYGERDGEIILPELSCRSLDLSGGEHVFVCDIPPRKKGKKL